MALSFSPYDSSDSYRILHDKLAWAFEYAFDKNEEIQESEAVKTLAEWYTEAKAFKEEREEDGSNKNAVLSLIANKLTTELVTLVTPWYKDSIIDSVGLNTHFKTGATQLNLNVEFISLKPFVKFVKQVNREEVASIKFRFELDTNVYMKKLQIQSSAAGGKCIDIDALGVELKLSLLQVNISRMPVPIITLKEPIILITRKFEINNLSFPIEQSTLSKEKT